MPSQHRAWVRRKGRLLNSAYRAGWIRQTARASGGAVHAVSEAAIWAHTALLSETAGIDVDCAGGAAFGALAESIRRGEVERGSQVVLVITGTQPSDLDDRDGNVTEALEPDVQHILAALGLGS